jgi:hypothetical protein
MRRSYWCLVIASLLQTVGTLRGLAGVIPLQNSSFELPLLSGGSYSVGNIPGWTKEGQTQSMGNVYASLPWYQSSAPAGADGNQAGFFYLIQPEETAGMYQALTSAYEADELYTLTMSFGLRSDGETLREGSEFGFLHC